MVTWLPDSLYTDAFLQQDRGGITAAFDKDDFEAPNVQINFVQHDLACKQRALEQLEQRCLDAISVEERRRFAELSTCLEPVLVSSSCAC